MPPYTLIIRPALPDRIYSIAMKYLSFFFLYFIFPAILFATDNVIERTYPVPGHGELILKVPGDWDVTYLSLAEDKPPVITFYQTDNQKREVFQFNLSILWDDGFKRDIRNPENIKSLVTNVGESILESSEESELVLNSISGSDGQGYYFKLSDKAEKAGEYKYLAQGALSVGEVLLVFSLFTYKPDTQLQNMALEMVQTAIHKFQRDI